MSMADDAMDLIKRPKFSTPKPKTVCHVCGDVASHFNFNVITCEPCKSFFRRNFDKRKDLTCSFDGKCNININTRRFCSTCRLKKCFDVGMTMESSPNSTTRETSPENFSMMENTLKCAHDNQQNIHPHVSAISPPEKTFSLPSTPLSSFNMCGLTWSMLNTAPFNTIPTKTAISFDPTPQLNEALITTLPETPTSSIISNTCPLQDERKQSSSENCLDDEDYVKVPVKFLKFLIDQKPDINQYIKENSKAGRSGADELSHNLKGHVRKSEHKGRKCHCRCSCGRYSKKWLIVDKVMTDFLNYSAKQGNPPIEDLVSTSKS